MDFIATRIPYRQTSQFNKIVLDYIDQSEPLRPFYTYQPSLQGVQQAIAARRQFATRRDLLVQELKKQYSGISVTAKVEANIESLLSEQTFTVTTAHQNNIFTGPLYFIYKILHTIKLAEQLKGLLPEQHFVPVFYIGSEDADLDELNHIYLHGEKLTWDTTQKGAVGRMVIDRALVNLFGQMEGQLTVLPFGAEIISMLRQYYKEGATIQDATFQFVNYLFGEYGLVILLPDNPVLKKQMIPVFRDDLLHQAASGIVEQTTGQLAAAGYKVQASPREINLFYLENDIRERIEKQNGRYAVVNTGLSLDEASLLNKLQEHPECFSPNVILRGLYQETILPNIAFTGGGGETAYWLQLKDLFTHYAIPFPVLVLRNSFMLVEKKWEEKVRRLGFKTDDFFLAAGELINKIVLKGSGKAITLNGSYSQAEELYAVLEKQADAVDTTLAKHVAALKAKALDRLKELEKKMLRAEKRKYTDQQRQVHHIKDQLFPGGGLQERRENLAYYYALWGKDFISRLYDYSLALEHEFVVLVEKNP